MKVRTAVLVISLLSVAIVFVTYKCRGYWAVGSVWFLPGILAMVIPLKDGKES